MLGHFGFSYVGLIYLLMLFIPNIIWSKNQPIDYDTTHENKCVLNAVILASVVNAVLDDTSDPILTVPK